MFKFRSSSDCASSSSRKQLKVPGLRIPSTCADFNLHVRSTRIYSELLEPELKTSKPTQVFEPVIDDLEALIETLPGDIGEKLAKHDDRPNLLEIVLDLGRNPYARFQSKTQILSDSKVTREQLRYAAARVGEFGPDNRAGIEGTLHRISAIRNRNEDIIGLTCRIGRTVRGPQEMVSDLLKDTSSILFLGPPGIGKTTVIRDIARTFSDTYRRRVVIIDTSNEIAGDGDVPHPAIGGSRRMQVARHRNQAEVMNSVTRTIGGLWSCLESENKAPLQYNLQPDSSAEKFPFTSTDYSGLIKNLKNYESSSIQLQIEAVENHMPEVIIVDEIGTKEEALACRTIAERGVTLVATAHGQYLENLMNNPVLSDLVGGIRPVTLGDEAARARNSQKTVRERAAPSTFPTVIEMIARESWIEHDTEESVDRFLLDEVPLVTARNLDKDNGKVKVTQQQYREPSALSFDARSMSMADSAHSLSYDELADALNSQYSTSVSSSELDSWGMLSHDTDGAPVHQSRMGTSLELAHGMDDVGVLSMLQNTSLKPRGNGGKAGRRKSSGNRRQK